MDVFEAVIAVVDVIVVFDCACVVCVLFPFWLFGFVVLFAFGFPFDVCCDVFVILFEL
jgi:hypothetical protein